MYLLYHLDLNSKIFVKTEFCMTLPDFYIAGFRKCGTTTLCDWLGQHPEICAPSPKEPNVFAFDDLNSNNFTFFEAKKRWWEADVDEFPERELKRYNRVFEKCIENQIKFDGTPNYINSTKALERIKYYTPEAKIIIMLRHPLHRAISDYNFTLQQRRASFSFEKHIKYEKTTVLDDSLYLHHLKNLFRIFDSQNVLVLTLEEMMKDSDKLIKEVASFLDLPDWVPEKNKKNTSIYFHSQNLQVFLNKLPKLWLGRYNTINHYNSHLIEEEEFFFNKYATKFINKLGELNKTKKKKQLKISSKFQNQLNEYFVRENRGLSKLIGKDLGKLWDLNI